MKFVFLFTLVTCLNAQIAPTPAIQDGKDGESQQKLIDSVSAAATLLGKPEVAAAIELISKVVKRDSSSTIGEVHDAGVQFYNFSSTVDYSTGATLFSNIDRLFDIWLSDTMFDTMVPSYKTIIAYTIKEYALQLRESKYIKQKFSINYENGQGTIYSIIIVLEQYSKNADAIAWIKQTLTGGFAPARDWVIVTTSRSNFFGSRRTDQIVYFPPVLKEGHIRAFIDANRNMLDAFHTSLLTRYN